MTTAQKESQVTMKVLSCQLLALLKLKTCTEKELYLEVEENVEWRIQNKWKIKSCNFAIEMLQKYRLRNI